ncbi:MAG TPA: isoprenylcysteine carboxylmethyltransferase family protein [Burkholderiaceae bacterium]|nr:isoprenylcysteine carboxylmethyltransferase family protein [Burkholderiaceae bacterium]
MRSAPRLPSWSLVALQLGLIAVLVLGTDLSSVRQALPPAIALLAIGMALGLWTVSVNRWGNFNIRPEVKRGARLITNGPYRWIRHPMYSAVLLGTAAFVVADSNAARVALYVSLVIVLVIKAGREEEFLRAAFPEYDSYAAGTRRFIPMVW